MNKNNDCEGKIYTDRSLLQKCLFPGVGYHFSVSFERILYFVRLFLQIVLMTVYLKDVKCGYLIEMVSFGTFILRAKLMHQK